MKNKPFRLRVLSLVLPAVFTLIPAAVSSAQSGANARAEISDVPVSTVPVWEQDLQGTVSGQLFLQAESAVAAIDHGSIKSYSMYGTLLWDFDPRGSVAPYLARNPEGTTYVCNTAGSFMAINRVGRELWRTNLGTPITHPAVIGWDGRVFIPVGSEIACRTGSGNPLWKHDLGSSIAVAPVLDRAGGIALALENGDFVRLDEFGGMERVRLDRIPSIIVPLKSEQDNGYYLLYPNGGAEMIRMDTAAGKGSRLSRSSRPALSAAPVAAAGYQDQVAVTFRDGRIQLLSSGGQIRWTGNSHETAAEKGSGNVSAQTAAMVFDERGVYLLSTRGASAFAAGGRRRWMLHIDETMTVPGLSNEGLIYACGKDRILRAYKADNKPKDVPRSMFGPSPEGSYGLGNPPPSPWADSTYRYEEREIKAMYERIDQATQNGTVGEMETAYVGYLMEMTAGILNTPHYSRVRPPIQVPERVKLIKLLAQMGSRETVPFLTNLFYRDAEPSIKAACCEAIGRIGVDPNGDAYRAYSVLLSPDNANRDPMTLMAAISSIAALCRFSGPPLADSGIRLLYAFSHMDYPPAVKRQVQKELDGLRREGLDKPLR
ncbi:PQQ-binding-like beta-propeller repeat protein [Breznakiella homolactica]|uniref:PQQ-binding-like beta-propeller repeat protein n=1 Tax=Breznakiella homolactica TaxID=2798577 RepID=A0A7T8B9S9_9SPIR|nr:PQQ-binding-like beta-propeller repeat protein [Breznakiella homolactica]QQO08270.1 PQQ-binding-like beta-propeller repeat protein [Breznakiella homolactica]